MKRAAYVALFSFLGCSTNVDSSPAQVLLVDSGVLASVSADQQLLAYYTDTPDAWTKRGTPWVRPLPAGAPIGLGKQAFGLSFGRTGDTLSFNANAVPATDSAKNVPGTFFGNFSLWTPALAAPVEVSDAFEMSFRQTPDASVGILYDHPTPTVAGKGAFRSFRADECAGATCGAITLAEDVDIADSTVSADGRFAAYEVFNDDLTHDVFLATIPGAVMKVASTAGAKYANYQVPLAFSPDGALFATAGVVNGNPSQLVVISTSTGSPVAWGAQPAGNLCARLAFLDSTTLFSELVDPQGKRAVYRSSPASAATHFLDATWFSLYPPTTTPAAKGVMLFGTSDPKTWTAGILGDLRMVDPAAAAPSPVFLAQTTAVWSLSEDHTAAWFLDDYDPQTQFGTLRFTSIPGGTVVTVAAPVFGGAPSFARGSTRLLYFATPPAPDPAIAGGPLLVWNGTDSVELEANALNYVTADSPPTVYVGAADPPRIYRLALH